MKSCLRLLIRKEIRNGVTNFMTGLAKGVDTYAAQIVYDEKKNFPHIVLEGAAPGLEENTRALKERYEKAGVETVFELNPGNHFRDAEARMARGIVWMLGETSGAMDWHSETKGC